MSTLFGAKTALTCAAAGKWEQKVEMETNGQIIMYMYPRVKPLYIGHLLKITFL